MNKFLCILFAIVFLMCGCSSRSYEYGYEEGYEVGHKEGISEEKWRAEEAYNNGSKDGYSQGYRKGYDDAKCNYSLSLVAKAEDYAREKSGLSVYEAWCYISVYNDRTSTDEVGFPTYEEYQQSIDSLACFYEYMNDSSLWE